MLHEVSCPINEKVFIFLQLFQKRLQKRTEFMLTEKYAYAKMNSDKPKTKSKYVGILSSKRAADGETAV